MLRMLKVSVGVLSFAAMLFACEKDGDTVAPWRKYNPYNGIIIGSDGSANVPKNGSTVINVPIENNINAEGYVELGSGASVGGDINLNPGGKVVVHTINQFDTIFVESNANLNDSLLVKKGVIVFDGDMNVNGGGAVNCEPLGQIIVRGTLNNNGSVYGLKYFQVAVDINDNGSKAHEQESLYQSVFE